MENSAPSLKISAFRTLCKIMAIKIGGKTRFEIDRFSCNFYILYFVYTYFVTIINTSCVYGFLDNLMHVRILNEHFVLLDVNVVK